MSIIIEGDSAFDKEALTKILECCSEQPQTFQYLINQACSCLLSPPASDAVAPTYCLRALRCAEMAFRLWDRGLRDSTLLLQLTSHRVVNDVSQNEEVSQQTERFSANDVLTADEFGEIITESDLKSAETLLSHCFPTPSSTLAAAILQYGQKSVVYLEIPFENSLIHAVFDPHLRLDHPSGPSFLISWKPIDIHALQIFPISLINEASACRIQRLSSPAAPLPMETLNAATNTIHREDFDQDGMPKSASSRTSWTLIESNPLLVHGDDMCPLGPDMDMSTGTSGYVFGNPPESVTLEAVAVSTERCGPHETNAPTTFPENETADPIERNRFSNIYSQNKLSDDFVPDHFQNSRDNILFHEEWVDEPTTPPISPRSYRSTLQPNVLSSPAWSNQSSSPNSDDGDIFRPFQPPWTLRPPSPPFLQSYSSSSRSIANFGIEDSYPFSDNNFYLPSFTDPGSDRTPSCAGPTAPFWLRSPLSKPQKDGPSKEPFPEAQDFQVPSLQRLVTTGHFAHSTIPRNKQKQKRNDLPHPGHFASCPLPGVLGRASNEEFSPYTSAENLNPRPGSAPESDGMSSRAGPSRLGSLDSQWRRNSRLEREGPSFQGHSVDILTHQAMSEEDWEVALLRQLQEEEEIAASVAHQISVDAAWMVKLQQFLAQQKLAHGSPSSLSTSFELDRQLALQLQQEEENITSRTDYSRFAHENPPDPEKLSEPIDSNFECGICHERCDKDMKISVVDCEHSYCRECLGFLARAKIEDNRFPILCPDCLIDRSRTVKSQISMDILRGLDLSLRELERLDELQTLSHSVVLECPRCNQRISINRPEYGERKFIICEGRECGYKWCRDCLKPLRNLDDRHRCKNENIERLMRRKGWKYCPGCRTPVQKESGCNHMTCSAPGCNAHFCYRCGVLIVDTTHGGDVGLTVTEHYANSRCRLFDRRYCTIQ